MPKPKTDIESLAKSFVSEDSEAGRNGRANLIDQFSTDDEKAEEETKKVISAITCEFNCKTAKQERSFPYRKDMQSIFYAAYHMLKPKYFVVALPSRDLNSSNLPL